MAGHRLQGGGLAPGGAASLAQARQPPSPPPLRAPARACRAGPRSPCWPPALPALRGTAGLEAVQGQGSGLSKATKCRWERAATTT
jgi:hypothetical protein